MVSAKERRKEHTIHRARYWTQAFRGAAVSVRRPAPARLQQRARSATVADAVKTESEYSTKVQVGTIVQVVRASSIL